MSRMPVLFVGHGSPMNAMAKNNYTHALHQIGTKLPPPKAVLVISAHWQTSGVCVTAMENPKTIHDFYGFPKELYEIQYPALGSPELAKQIANQIHNPKISLDSTSWGLDHGAWSVLIHLFPKANVPVIQISLEKNQGPEFHFQLGNQISFLRDQGVLILGSGNIVHNLQKIIWNEEAPPFDWALDFDKMIEDHLRTQPFQTLAAKVNESKLTPLAHPTTEHLQPLFTVLGAANNKDPLDFFFEGFQHGSISMRCLKLG